MINYVGQNDELNESIDDFNETIEHFDIRGEGLTENERRFFIADIRASLPTAMDSLLQIIDRSQVLDPVWYQQKANKNQLLEELQSLISFAKQVGVGNAAFSPNTMEYQRRLDRQVNWCGYQSREVVRGVKAGFIGLFAPFRIISEPKQTAQNFVDALYFILRHPIDTGTALLMVVWERPAFVFFNVVTTYYGWEQFLALTNKVVGYCEKVAIEASKDLTILEKTVQEVSQKLADADKAEKIAVASQLKAAEKVKQATVATFEGYLPAAPISRVVGAGPSSPGVYIKPTKEAFMQLDKAKKHLEAAEKTLNAIRSEKAIIAAGLEAKAAKTTELTTRASNLTRRLNYVTEATKAAKGVEGTSLVTHKISTFPVIRDAESIRDAMDTNNSDTINPGQYYQESDQQRNYSPVNDGKIKSEYEKRKLALIEKVNKLKLRLYGDEVQSKYQIVSHI